MLKKLLLLFLMFSSFSFARYVNQCKILSVDGREDFSFKCKSLETGKIFTFEMESLPDGEPVTSYVYYHKVGKVYKIWFHESNGYYFWERSVPINSNNQKSIFFGD